MKCKKLLSFLTAATMTASAFAAFAVTASADYSKVTEGTETTLTWDFKEYSGQIVLGANGSDNFTDYEGLTLYGNKGNSSDYVSAAGGFHMNGTSSASTRYIEYTPEYSGNLVVNYRSNNKTATDRITAIGTEVIAFKDTSAAPESVLASGNTNGNTFTSINADLTAGTKYYIFFANGGQNIGSLTYTYTESTEPIESEQPSEPVESEQPSEPVESEVPAVQQKLPLDTEIVFDDAIGSVADGAVVAGYLKVSDSKAKVAIDANNKTVDGTKYTSRIKSGGNSAVYTLIPAASGTLRVVAASSKNGEDREFTVNGTSATAGSDPAVFEFDVNADEEVTIAFPGGGVNIYGIKLVEKSTEPEITVTSTVGEKAAYTKADGYDADVVVGIIDLTVENGSIDLNSATYEGRTPTSVTGTDAPEAFQGEALITVIINNATSTDALDNVKFD